MRSRPSVSERASAENTLRPGTASTTGARYSALARAAIAIAALTVSGACAPESVSVTLHATVVPVCRFLTSASTSRSAAYGSATLTYACSNGAAAAFTFVAPAATNVACTTCSSIPLAKGTILSTSVGRGQGLGSGRGKTLTVRAPLAHAAGDDATPAGDPDTIIVTVSP